jgi:hypothetical protein
VAVVHGAAGWAAWGWAAGAGERARAVASIRMRIRRRYTKVGPGAIAALDDRDVTVAWAASGALLSMKDGQAYDIPYEILTGRRKGNSSLSVQAHETLRDPGRMADLVVTHGINFAPYGGYALALLKALEGRSDIRARAAAALALAHDPDPQAGQALVEAVFGRGGVLERESAVRVAALRAIAERGDGALLPGIAPALADQDENVRLMAAAAVLRLPPRRAPAADLGDTPRPPRR